MQQDIITTMLKSKSLGITKVRVNVLSYLTQNSQRLISLQEILRMPGKKVNRITLYRTMQTLCSAGLVYRILNSGNKGLYAVNTTVKDIEMRRHPSGKDYFHFQCISCDEIFCLHDRPQKMKLPEGFFITDANLLLKGYCAKCAADFIPEPPTKKGD